MSKLLGGAAWLVGMVLAIAFEIEAYFARERVIPFIRMGLCEHGISRRACPECSSRRYPHAAIAQSLSDHARKTQARAARLARV